MNHVVDLGCGSHRDPEATLGLDYYATRAADLRGSVLALPFRDGSLAGLRAHQVIEHLPLDGGRGGRDPFFAFFDECWRVLRPNGVLAFDVPHARGYAAFGDPTHRRFFTPESFSHLWDPSRDPSYPRRPWRLVDLRTRRAYDTSSHLDLRRPILDAVLRRWFERVGPPAFIFGVLRKEADAHDPDTCPTCVGGDGWDGYVNR